MYGGGGGGGGGKSQYPYVGLNSSVTECPIEIIFAGMTYFHHWFKEFVKSKHICGHFFFQIKVHYVRSGDQVIGLRLDPHFGNRAEIPITVS